MRRAFTDPAADRPAQRETAEGLLASSNVRASEAVSVRATLASRDSEQHAETPVGCGRPRSPILESLPGTVATSDHAQHHDPGTPHLKQLPERGFLQSMSGPFHIRSVTYGKGPDTFSGRCVLSPAR